MTTAEDIVLCSVKQISTFIRHLSVVPTCDMFFKTHGGAKWPKTFVVTVRLKNETKRRSKQNVDSVANRVGSCT